MAIETGSRSSAEQASPYYAKYEQRYQAVHAAGGSWGFSPEDTVLTDVLTQWVQDHGLAGKRIIEFACGEGGAGKILSGFGCTYHGVDLAPSAIETAAALLKDCPNATVTRLDMVNDRISEIYDAALDIMGFHILITDSDRQRYLKNVYNCLSPGAPVLFYRQVFRENAYDGPVESYEQWTTLMGIDYDTAEKRSARTADGTVEVMLPRIAGRGHSEAGYRKEFAEAGFVVDRFEPWTEGKLAFRASIWCHKPA